MKNSYFKEHDEFTYIFIKLLYITNTVYIINNNYCTYSIYYFYNINTYQYLYKKYINNNL